MCHYWVYTGYANDDLEPGGAILDTVEFLGVVEFRHVGFSWLFLTPMEADILYDWLKDRDMGKLDVVQKGALTQTVQTSLSVSAQIAASLSLTGDLSRFQGNRRLHLTNTRAHMIMCARIRGKRLNDLCISGET